MAITIAAVEVGGTGANTAAAARTNLGAAPAVAYDQANTAYDQANTARNQANTAFNQANTAFNAANNAFPSVNIVSSNTVTAIRANHYILKNASTTILTLPASPNVGDLIYITVANGLANNTVARNGNRIQGLLEDLTLNIANVSIQMRYIDANSGWLFT